MPKYTVENPYRWTVPRPNTETGEPLGVLKINVVSADAFDKMQEERDGYKKLAEELTAKLDAVRAAAQ
jgi:hypothetical protein